MSTGSKGTISSTVFAASSLFSTGSETTGSMASGSGNALENADKAIAEAYDLGFEDYSLGIQDLDLSDNIEIVESSVSSDEISSVEQALALLTEDQAVIQTYEVQPGDTLSAISLKLNIPMEILHMIFIFIDLFILMILFMSLKLIVIKNINSKVLENMIIYLILNLYL